MNFKNALISVSDKSGLVEFLSPYIKNGLRVVSTGGTAEHLKKNGIPVVDISEQTGFPEVMGGRVKTLHPKVHMALLARENIREDFQILKEQKIEPFDLVICNLYPFEQTVLKNASDDELIENIDIGGPSMLRGAAKNHQRVTVVCDPADYKWIAEKKEITLEDRRKLAAKVFAHVSSYDSLVAEKLGAGWGTEFSFSGRKTGELRYGENPQQNASWYAFLANQTGLHSASVLQGKALSYNNIMDLDAAAALVKEFSTPAVVAVKHNNPCGVATDADSMSALKRSLSADPVSVFGGIVALNFSVNKNHAEELSKIFLECIVAPNFDKDAVEVFSKKKNLRILHWPNILDAQKKIEIKSVNGGFLLQNPDSFSSDSNQWMFLSEKPSLEILNDLQFAEKVCASLKSNSIAIVKNGQTLGLGMGQVNRVEAVRHAIERMNEHHPGITGTILASDAFFPFPDSIEIAARAGIKWIIQPGGSVKDEEVFAAAHSLKINLVLTGTRHFKH